MGIKEFYEELKEFVPEHIYDLFWDTSKERSLIKKKYSLTDWQSDALKNISKDAFLKDISLIRIPTEIKNNLNIKDEKIAESISLYLAIHIFALDKKYFSSTDNLIKSLGGEERYWKKFSQSPKYWDEIVVAEPLNTPNDIEIKWREKKEAERREREEEAKKEAKRREKEEAERREREEAKRKERNKLEKKRHSKKIVVGAILFFVIFEVLTLIPWNNSDSQGTKQEVSPVPKGTDSPASYSTANEFVTKGDVLGRSGRYNEAIEAYDKAIEIDPKLAIAWSNKGNVLGRSGRYDEAIQALDKAIEIDPKLADALQSKGISLIGLGRYDEAIQALDKSIEIKPNNANAWTGKGIAFRHLGRYDEASVCDDKAAALKS